MTDQVSPRSRIGRLAPLAAAILLELGSHAQAATITVNQDTDNHIPGRCSLREAVQAADTDLVPAGTNCIPGGAEDIVEVASPQIALTQDPLEIVGARVRIRGTLPSSRTVITSSTTPAQRSRYLPIPRSASLARRPRQPR